MLAGWVNVRCDMIIMNAGMSQYNPNRVNRIICFDNLST